MKQRLRSFTQQPAIGIGTLGCSVLIMAIVYAASGAAILHQENQLVAWITPILVVAVILAYQFPMYIRHNTKLCVTTVPLYLLAVLLAPGLAMSAIGLAVLTGEMVVRSQRGSTLADIATHTGRWMLIGVLGSVTAHLGSGHSLGILHELPLLGAAIVLWSGDNLTLPLAVVPISGERPLAVMRTAVREGVLIEGGQYFVALLGALVAMQQFWALALLLLPTVLIYLGFKQEMSGDTLELLETMADTVDLRDPSTGGHSRRVMELTDGVLHSLGMRGQEAAIIRVAARLHDIGKIGLPDHVLVKPHSLTPDERLLIEAYPDHGADLLGRYPDFARGVEIVRHHHERWDGSGYPQRLAGLDIPFGARILAIADSFDAMTSNRPYRRALTTDRAAAVLLEGRGKQWDPALVDTFLRSIAHRLPSAVEPLVIRIVPDDFTSAVTA